MIRVRMIYQAARLALSMCKLARRFGPYLP